MMLVDDDNDLDPDDSLELLGKLITQSTFSLLEAEPGLKCTPNAIEDGFIKRTQKWEGLPLTATEEREKSVMRDFVTSAMIHIYVDPRDRRMHKKVTAQSESFLRSIDMKEFSVKVASLSPARPEVSRAPNQPSGERTLGDFEVGWASTPEGITLYICRCQVTDRRIIVTDRKGNTRQVLLSDVLGVRVDGHAMKLVKIDTRAGGLALSVKKDAAVRIPACIHQAMSG